VSRIAEAVNGTCIAVGYRKAPEHPYPAALEDGVASYEWLLQRGIDPSRIVLSGESAGGGLALAIAMRLRDRALPRPAGLIAICPMADFAVTGESVDATAGKDPICTRTLLTQFAANYLQTHDPRDPYISPIYGMFGGLPPMLVQVARNEALYSDAERMVAAARRDQVDVEFEVYDDTVHIFPIFTYLPESRQALKTIGDFVTKHVST
jgi:salicylate hydroxylase